MNLFSEQHVPASKLRELVGFVPQENIMMQHLVRLTSTWFSNLVYLNIKSGVFVTMSTSHQNKVIGKISVPVILASIQPQQRSHLTLA